MEKQTATIARKAPARRPVGRPRQQQGVADARERILKAASELFATHGYTGVSIRDVTRLAGVQIAALYHHFPSKAALLEGVLLWALEPLQTGRDAAFAALPDGAGLRDVLAAFIGPPLRQIAAGAHGRMVRRLGTRLFNDPSQEVRQILAGTFDRTVREFMKRLHDAAPRLDGDAYLWGMVCTFAVTIFVQSDLGRLPRLLGHRFDDDPERVIDLVARFIEGGLQNLQTA